MVAVRPLVTIAALLSVARQRSWEHTTSTLFTWKLLLLPIIGLSMVLAGFCTADGKASTSSPLKRSQLLLLDL